MAGEIKVVLYIDKTVDADVNPWRYTVKKGLPLYGGMVGASWDNLNHTEAVELFMIEMELDLTHNYTVDAGDEGDDLFAVTITPKKYTTDFDIAFSVKHDVEPSEITTEMILESLEQRIEEIKKGDIHDFEMGITFENF